MKKIGLLSDTHSHWDDRYARYFADCDEIWHAGDIGDISILERLQAIGPKVRAVRGNVDHGEVNRHASELEIFDVERVKVLLTHIGGYPGRWSPGMKKLLRDEGIRLMVDGHSHILRVMYDKELGLLHINPGAAGLQGWQKKRTLIRFVIDGEDIRHCEVIELG
ncbi:MAG: metallophosphoesterase family protein [Bacteroidales bacterium]|nr:metallophosphoesterase family protein [Bacteroidales bacterium]